MPPRWLCRLRKLTHSQMPVCGVFATSLASDAIRDSSISTQLRCSRISSSNSRANFSRAMQKSTRRQMSTILLIRPTVSARGHPLVFPVTAVNCCASKSARYPRTLCSAVSAFMRSEFTRAGWHESRVASSCFRTFACTFPSRSSTTSAEHQGRCCHAPRLLPPPSAVHVARRRFSAVRPFRFHPILIRTTALLARDTAILLPPQDVLGIVG